jgi:hypothetical protein
MPQILWTRYFLEAQGFTVKDAIIYQDNQSSILLEKHGRASSSKQTPSTHQHTVLFRDGQDRFRRRIRGVLPNSRNGGGLFHEAATRGTV